MLNTFRLSKSSYCSGIQCKKILWLDKYKDNVASAVDNDSILETGEQVGELAKCLFGEYKNIDYEQGHAQMLIKTSEYIEDGVPVITEASFAYKNNFCSVDIIKNHNGSLEIFEVKSSTAIKDVYLDDLAYQYYVVKKAGYHIDRINIVYLNNEYIRNGELELDKLFIIEDLTVTIMEKQPEVSVRIDAINEYMEQIEEPIQDIGTFCSEPYDCKYWKYCTRHLPEYNVFEISRLSKKDKFEYYYNSTYSYEDLKYSDLKPKYLEQVLHQVDNKPPKIEILEIKSFLKDIHYPLYFLDFETFQQAIPLFDGINPYMQIPFQYSLHYLDEENSELKHKEYLALTGVDPREELAKRLVEDIPTDACVLAYNMGFEKSVIKRLAASYPYLATELMLIHENFQDLMIPFQKRHYYAKEMHGSYSIKKVLPTLFPNDPELDYKELPLIHNGSEAMNAFRDLASKPDNEQEEIRKGLLLYCKLDTLAMVKIWQYLKEICNE